jgi:hypothetical protein
MNVIYLSCLPPVYLMVRRRFFSAVSNHGFTPPSFETRPSGRSSG